jgi:hypothetical protein
MFEDLSGNPLAVCWQGRQAFLAGGDVLGNLPVEGYDGCHEANGEIVWGAHEKIVSDNSLPRYTPSVCAIDTQMSLG